MALQPAVSSTDHIQGNPKADLEIVEYGDYQCPACGAAHPVIIEMMRRYGDQIKLVFRNFPLSQAHQYARPAAIAAEAAGKQGKFWEMHDAMYEDQNNLTDDHLLDLAEKIDLNIEEFRTALKDAEISQKVDSDFESGILSGVNGTPSFFVNGKIFDGGAENLLQLIDENVQ